ncbi:MAG: RluA family pseudouridine synthase [Phycisphaerae bacterium]|nr:RluA family pseudouridine synthase [Phycisphaerae bacterium]
MTKQKIEIIYEDADILAINKPSGLSVTKERSGKDQLMDLLTGQIGKGTADNLRLIHRLDKLISGVILIAKTKDAQSKYSSDFAKGKIEATYLALVKGCPARTRGRIGYKLRPDGKIMGKMAIAKKHSKDALTEWEQLANFGLLNLMAIRPKTDRTHQIRVHMPAAGMPLAIDPLYGDERGIYLSDFKSGYNLGKYAQEKPLIDRLTLHSYQIRFLDKINEKPQVFIAGLDKKFKTVIKMLTKHNPKGTEAFICDGVYEKIVNGEPLLLTN